MAVLRSTPVFTLSSGSAFGGSNRRGAREAQNSRGWSRQAPSHVGCCCLLLRASGQSRADTPSAISVSGCVCFSCHCLPAPSPLFHTQKHAWKHPGTILETSWKHPGTIEEERTEKKSVQLPLADLGHKFTHRAKNKLSHVPGSLADNKLKKTR